MKTGDIHSGVLTPSFQISDCRECPALDTQLYSGRNYCRGVRQQGSSRVFIRKGIPDWCPWRRDNLTIIEVKSILNRIPIRGLHL